MKYVGFAAGLCLAVVFAGCDSIRSSGGGVAVIDLDLAAQRLGRDGLMKEAIEQRQAYLNQQLATVQTSFQEQLASKKKEFGETPTEEQTQTLVNMEQEANVKLASIQQEAQANMTQFQQSLIIQFRDEAKPVAQKVAAEKGCKIVLTRNDNAMLVIDPAIDITEAMVARLPRAVPKPALPTVK